MKFQPLHDNIVVEEIKKEEKFGIQNDELSTKAKVISIGPMVQHIYIGDIIYMSINTGIKVNDTLVVKPYEILGKDSSKDVKQN